ncbi:MAG: hypothetical protein IPP44_29450 [Ideonella sp.]|nr:hypothetical protein [Ideonella sp.]
MMHSKALTALVLALANGAASAAVLFSTYGLSDSFNSHVLQYVGWGDVIGQPFQDRQVANRFTVSQAAELTHFRVQVSRFTGGLGDQEAFFSLWSGDTQPASLVEEALSFHTGSGLASTVELDSVAHPLLSPDETYWLVLAAPSPNLFRWYYSDQAPAAGWEIQYRFGTDPWSLAGSIASAFDVNGTPRAMPEPPSVALVLGVAALAGFAWRRTGPRRSDRAL